LSSGQQEISNKKEKSQASTTEYDKDKSNTEQKKKKAMPPSIKRKNDLEKLKRDLIIRAYQDDDDNRVQEEEEKITIDYMAKDYASFRNALLDLIPRKIPQWKDRSEADMGIMLIELFSYIADELSYFQDRVANEAFLRTARARSSVSNHLSLIDYPMQNGLSANAFIKVEVIEEPSLPAASEPSAIEQKAKEVAGEVKESKSAIIPAGFQISTYPERGKRRVGGEPAGIVIFETLQDQVVDARYNRIPVQEINSNNNFRGIMNPSAILQGRFPELKKGLYILLFEEPLIAGAALTDKAAAAVPAAGGAAPATGGAASSKAAEEKKKEKKEEEKKDLSTRLTVRPAIVKLAEDSKIISYEGDDNNTLITWEKGNEYPKVAYGRNANVFCCANIIKASHGRTIGSEILKQKHQEVSKFLFTLKEGPLAFISDTYSPSSSSLIESDSTLKVWVDGELWEETDSLLKCGPLDQKFSVSIDENGYATILFGDDKFGLKPEDDSLIKAEYRVGNGSVGNVGKDTLIRFNLPQNQSALVEQVIERVKNPLPATGGIDIESIDDAKIDGPKSLKSQQRAVTLKDYEHLVKREFQNEITNARARFVYTGSWDTIFVSVKLKGDRKNSSAIVDGSDLFDRIRKYLERIKMIGYEVQIEKAKYVPIEIRITVYLQKYLDSQTVRDRIRNSLTNADKIIDGTKGLFHPDNFTFGDPVYASKIYEVLKKTPEVKYGIITTFRRRSNSETVNSRDVVESSSSPPHHLSSEINVDYTRDKETKRNLELGYIPINEDEIITIDSDPSHPESGILTLDFIGDNETKDSDDDIAYQNYSLYDENSAW
jgi:Baseplate J-like protein